MARFYGFGHYLSSQQSWLQTIVLFIVFLAMAIPLGLSLKRIASEAVTVSQIRAVLTSEFGNRSRVTQLDVDFDKEPIAIRSVVIAPRDHVRKSGSLEERLEARLRQPISLQLDQVFLAAGAGALDVQKEELRQASDIAAAETARVSTVARLLSLAAGVAPEQVTIDREHRRASVAAAPLPEAGLAAYRTLERRAVAEVSDWELAIVPPQSELPQITFANGNDTLDASALDAVNLSIWAARRWNQRALTVPGLHASPSQEPLLAERRALAIARLLRTGGIAAVAAPSQGPSFRLRPPSAAP
jgi:hypothetical protein